MGYELSPQRRARRRQAATRAMRRAENLPYARAYKTAMTYDTWTRAGHPTTAIVTCPTCGQNHFASAHLHPVRGPMPSCVQCRNVFITRRSSTRTRSRAG